MIYDNENKYKLCTSFNGCLNIHMFTHNEIEWKDYTQVDWMVNEIKMTMRMNDYINLINCFYSNIEYSDNKNSLFTFDEFKNNSLIRSSGNLIEEKEKKKKRITFMFNLMFNNVDYSVLFENKETFAKLIATKLLLNFVSYNTTEKDINVSIEKVGLYEPLNQILFANEAIMDINTDLSKKIEDCYPLNYSSIAEYQNKDKLIKFLYQIKETKDSVITIKIGNVKLLAKFDILYLLFYFFIEKMPNDDNIYEEDEKTKKYIPKRNVIIEMKAPYFCLLSESNENLDQDVICLGCDYFYYMFNKNNEDKIKLNYDHYGKDGYDLSLMKVFLNKAEVYITTLSSFLNQNLNISNTKSHRKFINSFDFNYSSTIKLHRIENRYIYKTNYEILLGSAINVSLSYRDMLFMFKVKQYETSLSSNEHLITKCSIINADCGAAAPQSIIIDNNENSSTLSILLEQGASLTLINDENDTCYPFIYMNMYNISVKGEFTLKQMMINAKWNFKLKSYNYLESSWEPIIEEIGFGCEYNKDHMSGKTKIDVNDIGELHNNIAISDLGIEFLYLNVNKWYDYYKRINVNEKIVLEKSKKISNHRIHNYTGTEMVIVNEKNEIKMLNPNEILDVDFNPNGRKKMIYTFSLKNSQIDKNKINIDIIQSSKHFIQCNETNSLDYKKNYNFVISKVEINQLKKFIFFYSPLSIKNVTKIPIEITLISKPRKDIKITLNKDEIYGIPFTYFNGTISILPQGFHQGFTNRIYTLLEANGIVDEMRERNTFLLLFSKNRKVQPQQETNRIIYIRYSYCIKNLLPFNIAIQVKGTIRENEIVINKGDEIYTENISFFSNLDVNMRIPNISLDNTVTLYDAFKKANKKENDIIESITLYDMKGRNIEISAMCYDEEKRIIVLFASTVIVNLCDMENQIQFYYGNRANNLSLVPCQNEIANIFILNQKEQNLWISCKRILSNKIELETLSNITDITIENKDQSTKYNFILESKISLVDKEMNIYSIILTLRPKYYILNKTQYMLNVLLQDAKQNVKSFPSGKMIQYDFFGYDEKTKVIFRPYALQSNAVDFCESNAFSIIDPNIRTISIVDLDCKVHFFNIERHNEETSTLIVVKPANENTSQITIENKSDVDLEVNQENCISSRIKIEAKTKNVFTWHNHYTHKIISVKTATMSKGRLFRVNYSNVDGCMYPFITVIYIDDRDKSKQVHTRFENNGFQLKIIFDNVCEDNNVENTNEFISKYEIRFSLSKLCLSIIRDNKNLTVINNHLQYIRKEICLIYLVDMKLLFKNSISPIRKNTFKNSISFFVFKIVVGNETGPACYFPKVFNPIIDNKEEEVLPLLNCLVNYEVNEDDSIVNMELFHFSFQPFDLKLESNFVYEFFNFVQNFTIGTKTSMTSIHPVFLKVAQDEMNNKMKFFMKDNYIEFLTFDTNDGELLNNLFIQNIDIASFEFVLTFINQAGDFLTQFLKVNKVFSSFLSVLTDIKDVKIELNGCIINNFFGTFSDLSNAVYLHYKTHMLNQYLKLFAGIEILGNPNSLFNTLSDGVNDLFTQPQKGFKKGPLQGIVGIAKGGASLVTHTVEGAFGTASKISSGVSKGLLTIGQDEEYMRKREKNAMKDKPENVFEGFLFGMKSLGKGVFYGATDIVRQPIKEMKTENNIVGFGKGLLKGIGGVFTKPISGVFDLISKSAEGIKNNVKESSNDGLIRYPRGFYGKFKVIKDYKVLDAQINTALMCSEWKEYEEHNIGLCNVFEYINEKKQKMYLVITTQQIVFLDDTFHMKKYNIWCEDIWGIRYDKGNLLFNIKGKETVISMINTPQAMNIFEIVKKEIGNICENYEMEIA